MNKVADIENLVGKTIEAVIDTDPYLVIKTTDGHIAFLVGEYNTDRCGDIDGTYVYSEMQPEHELKLKYDLYSQEELDELERKKIEKASKLKKAKEDKKKKELWEKEQRRKAKELKELETLKTLAKKFNKKIS